MTSLVVIIVVPVELVPPIFLVSQIWQRESMLTYNNTVPLKSRFATYIYRVCRVLKSEVLIFPKPKTRKRQYNRRLFGLYFDGS